MTNILLINYPQETLQLAENIVLVPRFYGDYDYIITNDISKIDQCEHDIVLRNIDLVNGDVKRAITLHQFGQTISDYCIISSNCLAGFINQYLSKPQGGPCGFWRYDPHKFYKQLLNLDEESFINSLCQPKVYTNLNGHFFGTDMHWRVAFNHMKSTTNEAVQSHFEKRLKRFAKEKYVIILCLDRLNFTKEEVEQIAKVKPNVIFVTNYNLKMPNVFSYPNTDKQFYLKGMQFLNFCPERDIIRFIDFINNLKH